MKLLVVAFIATSASAGWWQNFCAKQMVQGDHFDDVATSHIAALAFRYQMQVRWNKILNAYERSEFELAKARLKTLREFGSLVQQAEVQMAIDDGLEL